jgi:AcrR family transcriptional regulator
MAEQPRQRDAERSRAAILDAAEALFAEHGFDAVTLA